MAEFSEREEFYNLIKNVLEDVYFYDDRLFDFTDDVRVFRVMSVDGSSMPLTEFMEMFINKLGVEIGG